MTKRAPWRVLGLVGLASFAVWSPVHAQSRNAPKITINSPAARTTQNAPQLSVPLVFTITTQSRLQRVWIEVVGESTQTGFELCGARAPCKGAPPSYSFRQPAPVFWGRNSITITAVDANGATVETSVRFAVAQPARPRARVVVPRSAPPPVIPLVPRVAAVSCRLVVVTPEGFNHELETAVQPLVDHKNATGMPTKLLTLEQIYNTLAYRGRDNAESVKNAIYDAYRRCGAKYVMLIGDVDRFPVRYTRIYDLASWGSGFAPSDLYYADLANASGELASWDTDRDLLFGEQQKDYARTAGAFNQDQMHLVPEVGVGRVPVSNANELRIYVNKVIQYELTADASWFKTALLVAGDYPGSDATNDAIGERLTAAGFQVVKRYDSSTPPAGRAALLQADLNAGAGLVSFVGHGGGVPDALQDGGLWGGWINDNDIVGLANHTMLPVITAAACSTAQFHFGSTYRTAHGFERTGAAWPDTSFNKYDDGPLPAPVQLSARDKDGFAEQFLVKRPNGAIAYMGSYTGTQGAAHDLAKDFYEAVASGNTVLGDVWKAALAKFIATYYTPLSYPTDRSGAFDSYHHMHKMLLFGDPSLRLGGLPRCPSYCPAPQCLARCDQRLEACLAELGDPGAPTRAQCAQMRQRCAQTCTVCETCRP